MTSRSLDAISLSPSSRFRSNGLSIPHTRSVIIPLRTIVQQLEFVEQVYQRIENYQPQYRFRQFNDLSLRSLLVTLWYHRWILNWITEVSFLYETDWIEDSYERSGGSSAAGREYDSGDSGENGGWEGGDAGRWKGERERMGRSG